MACTEVGSSHLHTKDSHSNPDEHNKDDESMTFEETSNDSHSEEIDILNSIGLTDTDKNEDGTISQSAVEKLKIESWNDYPWQCVDCNILMVDIHDLRQHHISNHQSTSKYCCVDCPKVFNKYATFLNHVRGSHRSHLRFWYTL